jgi:hypothetical protein
MNKNDNEDINKIIETIIRKQNLILIKKISEDYNRNYKVLIKKYYNGKYD